MQLFKKPESGAPKRGDEESGNDVADAASDARSKLEELDARIAAEKREREERQQEKAAREERARVRRAQEERQRQARASCCGCCWS